MGRIFCPQHGMQGIAFVCPHLSEALDKNEPVPKAVFFTVDLDFEGYKMSASLCPTCVALAISDCGKLDRFGEEGLDWFFELETKPVCSSCLAEASGEQ